ncbi:MAG: class B sortase [Lachnospiraceae bacterium]|nr:class B sortase [Lachnospiraceae bacterium]
MWINMKKAGVSVFLVLVIGVVCACGNTYTEEHKTEMTEEAAKTLGNIGNDSKIRESFAGESAADAQIDFDALREINSDIFAWIYIPDTAIDCPVLQSEQSDTFYEEHNAYGEEDDTGAVYIELANLASMCDFNTVLHGKTGADEAGLFADLYRFADSDFFKDHEYVYLYLDGNVLTYEIFAAYERENTSMIRTYDFTYLSGCRQFLSDLYGARGMSMNLREGWENVNEYHYVITLTTQKEENAESQFVVVAVLIQDAAGTINRVVTE